MTSSVPGLLLAAGNPCGAGSLPGPKSFVGRFFLAKGAKQTKFKQLDIQFRSMRAGYRKEKVLLSVPELWEGQSTFVANSLTGSSP